MRDIFHVTTRGVKANKPHWEQGTSETNNDFTVDNNNNVVTLGDIVLIISLSETADTFGEMYANSNAKHLLKRSRVQAIDNDGNVYVEDTWLSSGDVLLREFDK